jgi:hypothetical protein
MKSVYCAVRTGSLNKTVHASFLKVNVHCYFRNWKCDQEISREKIRYEDLTIEQQRMWNVKTKAIPVIIGVTGTISISFRK